MKQRILLRIGVLLLFVMAIAASAVFVWLNWNRQDVANDEAIAEQKELPTAKDEAIDEMVVGKGLKLKFIRLYPGKEIYVTESPITNAQYAVAVAEEAVFPPQLPHELYPEEGYTAAQWREVAWTTPTFPKGQESSVVLFVNHADAVAYCEWLQRRNPKYDFRLPTSMESMEWHDPQAQLFRRILESKSAFPRPAEGPGAARIFNRFWVAPWTHELFDLNYHVFERDPEKKKFYLDSFAPSGRYRPHVFGSIGTARVVPTTFRVVAVKKVH